jgi:hypothetical protein
MGNCHLGLEASMNRPIPTLKKALGSAVARAPSRIQRSGPRDSTLNRINVKDYAKTILTKMAAVRQRFKDPARRYPHPSWELAAPVVTVS